MRKVLATVFLVLLIVTSVSISSCYALEITSNGYGWNSADTKDKVAICKIIAGQVGKPYTWWLEALNEMYDTTNEIVLNTSIARGAAQMTVYLKHLEGHGQ